jgi:hypothetical protein
MAKSAADDFLRGSNLGPWMCKDIDRYLSQFPGKERQKEILENDLCVPLERYKLLKELMRGLYPHLVG